MSFQLDIADINPNKISLANEENLDISTEGFVYEHLLYYCSKFFPIPSITVKIQQDSIVAISRVIYLQIAKDLNLASVRAVIDKSSDIETVKTLIQRKEITLLDFEEIRNIKNPINYSWHVLFFEHPLSQSEKEVFKKLIFEHFNSQNYSEINKNNNAITIFDYSHSDTCVEFCAITAFEDYDRANYFRQKLINFHSEVVKIVSYQGRKFFTV